MEEILASIRRIIADDQAHSETLPDESVDGDTDVDAGAITFDDDVLQGDEALVTAAAETPADIPASAQPRPAARAPQHAAAATPPAATPSPSTPPAAAAQTHPVAESTAKATAGATSEATTAALQDRLLSSAADASASSAFQALSSVVLSRSPRTLDDLMQDMLRPLLKAWLDEKLPPLVEKLVQAEIERISRNGR